MKIAMFILAAFYMILDLTVPPGNDTFYIIAIIFLCTGVVCDRIDSLKQFNKEGE